MQSSASTTIDPSLVDGEVVVDERSDIYSLGMTAYYLLTGHGIFETERASEIITILQNDVMFKNFFRVALQQIEQEAVRTLLARMIAFNPGKRFQHVYEIIERINATFGCSFPGQLAQKGSS